MAKSDTIVKVWNRNKYEYRELFKGKEIVIAAGKFVEMDYEQAISFLGKMCPIKKDKHGVCLPDSFKKLEIDQDDKRKAELSLRDEAEERSKKTFVCMKCMKEFTSKPNPC